MLQTRYQCPWLGKKCHLPILLLWQLQVMIVSNSLNNFGSASLQENYFRFSSGLISFLEKHLADGHKVEQMDPRHLGITNGYLQDIVLKPAKSSSMKSEKS